MREPSRGASRKAAEPVNRPLRIAIADDEPDIRMFFREVLTQMGHQIVAEAATGRELVERAREAKPDLVITDIRMPDMDGLEAAAAVNRERQVPVVLVTAHPESDFLAHGGGHVMAYLSKPIKPVDLLAAIQLAVLRFEQFQQLTKEAASLRQALEDRKVIERAKGIVMKRLKVDEEDAFRRLRKMAGDHNRKLIEVATQVVTADEPFHRLELL
jgi:response regulator NasT